MTPGVTPHALGKVTATRIVKRSETARFIIDFESEVLKSLPAETGLTSLIETPENAPIIEKQLTKNPATGGWRLSFAVKLPNQDSVVQSIISVREGSPRLRFRALLKKGENLPDPLTEEWIYDLPS
jgi:glucans biosynthesis protein